MSRTWRGFPISSTVGKGLGGTAWPLFSGDRFDDQAMFTARIERDGCSCDGILHESGDSRVVKKFGRRQDDVLRDSSVALELLLRIGETFGL